jgi:thymidylate synthase (FAD)
MAHETNELAEALLDERMEVLDHGFVQLVDYMGGDRRIAEAAWVSSIDEVDAEKKKPAAIKRIIRYMMEHGHTCYDEKTEVLTKYGFVPWSNLAPGAELGVWNPDTQSLQYEQPKRLVRERYDGKMYRVDHGGVDLLVTPDHYMWVARRKWDAADGRSVFAGYQLARAKGLDDATMVRYCKVAPLRRLDEDPLDKVPIEVDDREAFLRLCGFFVGDGTVASRNVIAFNLRRQRKISWLREVAEELGSPWRFYRTASGVCCLTYENVGTLFKEMFYTVDRQKRLPRTLELLCEQDSIALLDGLKNSDGSIKRGAWQYSTTSKQLAQQVQITALHAGVAAHVREDHDGLCNVMMLSRMHSPIINQSRKNTAWENYHGEVFCAETTTGILVVRRNGKIVLSGNSPFEQVVLTFRCKMPIFVARQWVRHRMARLNEMSGRYRILPMEAYVPTEARLMGKGKTNKQGSEGELDEEVKPTILHSMKRDQGILYASYDWYDQQGLANELARINVPVSQYTEWYWQSDLHNLFRFLRLRLDSHAQWEIRQYAEKLSLAARAVAPVAYDAFLEFQLNACTFSATELRALKLMHNNGVSAALAAEDVGLTGSSLDRFFGKLAA